MLTWYELQKQARKIIENKPTGEFKDESFTCGSGGAPANKIGLPEIHRGNEARYNTVRNGRAYFGEVVIRCRNTGAKDKNGRDIYEAENGQVFVYNYSKGSPDFFDSGSLENPQI